MRLVSGVCLTDIGAMQRFRPSSRSIVTATVLFAAFMVMASIFAPGRLQAGAENRDSSAYSSEFIEDTTPLGQVEGNQYTVKFHASPDGPLYSVYDRDGRQLAELLTAAEVTHRFPSLPLPEAHADVTLDSMGNDR